MTAKSKTPALASIKISKAELGRREKFCLEYVLNGENGAAAYREIWPKTKAGCERTMAYRLLQDVHVRARVKELKQQHHELLMATHHEVLQEVNGLAFFDPEQMFDPETGQLLTLDQMPAVARKSVNEIEMIIADDNGVPFRMAKVKYGKDKKAYLDMLMKHYNQYEAHRVAGSVQPVTVYLHPADQDL